MPDLHVHQADAHAERKTALAHLGEERHARLLLAIDLRNTPDRGLLRSIAECSHRAARTGVWLLGGEAGNPERVALWRDRLGEIGLPERDCLTDQPNAARWLENDQ